MAEQVRFWHSNTSNLYDSSNGNLKNGDIIFSKSLGQILDWGTKTFYGIQWVSGTSGDALLRLRHDYFSNNKQGNNTVDILTTNASVTNLHSYLTIKTNGPLTGAPTNKSEGLVTLGINSADASNLGVVYLSDSTSSTLDASSHHAASSKAVKDAMDKAVSAYNLANSKTNNTGTVTSITPGIGLTNGTTKNSITTSGTLNLKSASATELGGIQIGYSDNNRNYGVLLDNNKAYVHIPWTDTTYTLSSKGSNASNANDNNNPYIQIGNNANQKIKITGRGKTSVTRTSDQEITINSTWPTLSDLSGISSITYSGTAPSGAYFVSSTTASGNTVSVNYGILSGSKHITVSKATNSNNIAISIDSGYSIPSDQSLANFQNAYNWFVSVTDPSVNGKIDKWNEIEAFLKGISDSSTLTGIIESNSASLTNNLTISIDSSVNGVINVKQGGNLVKSLDFSHTHKWNDITNKPSLVNSIAGQTGAVTVNAIISTLEEDTSIITDNTEILTSYASNNGFADSNAKNTLYKRDAVHLYDYIKTKLGTDKFNTTYSQKISQSTTNDNNNPYISLVDSNNSVDNIQISAGTGISIVRNSDDKLTITNTQPDKDHNTHYSTHFYVGSSQSGTNTTTTVTNPYLQIYDDSTYRNQVQLKGEGNSTVTSINGVVTIKSIGYTSINHPSSGVIEFSGYGVDDVSLNFNHTHTTSSLTNDLHWTDNTGTVTMVSGNNGLTGSVTTNGYIGMNLVDSSLSSYNASKQGDSTQIYPVVLDKSGHPAVIVPWTDNREPIFNNNKWYAVGDDVLIGDCNIADHLGIKSANGGTTTGIAFWSQSGTEIGRLTNYNGTLKFKDAVLTTGIDATTAPSSTTTYLSTVQQQTMFWHELD